MSLRATWQSTVDRHGTAIAIARTTLVELTRDDKTNMTKIAPGGDHMSDASQQSAQQMVQAAKITKAVKEATDPTGSSEAPRMKLAVTKIVHTPETPADYAKRVMLDKELKNLKTE